MSAIEVVGVGKRFRRAVGRRPSLRYGRGSRGPETWALKDISLSVEPGESVALIGANGCGKSTLLRIIAGTTRPTIGSVRVTQVISGLLTLGDSLEPLLSGEENALTASILAGVRRRDAMRLLPKIAAFAELEDHLDKPLRTYSDGMRLRLAFAVSMHVDPELLLIDEVLAVGDVRFRDRCLRRLEDLREEGTTIVLTSHSLHEVARICPRSVWIHDGVVRLDGATDDVAYRYENMMRATLPPPEDTGDGSLRMGNRQVEITSVRLVDAAGEDVSWVRPGLPIAVEIDFLAHTPVAAPIFGVSIHADESGLMCLDLHDEQEEGTVMDAGPGKVRLAVDRLDLADGRYHLDVGIYAEQWEQVFDYRWQMLSFDVGRGRSKGVIIPPHEWSRT